MQEYCAVSLNILLILAPFTHISGMHPHASLLKSQKTLFIWNFYFPLP